MLRERVGDHSECIVLNASEVLWHEGHDRGTNRNCYLVLQGRINVEFSSLPGDIREHRLLKSKKHAVIQGRPMSRKLRMVQKLMIACKTKREEKKQDEKIKKVDDEEKIAGVSVSSSLPNIIHAGSFHFGDVLDAHTILQNTESSPHAFTARAGSQGGAVLLRISRDLIMSHSSHFQKILTAQFLAHESGIAWERGGFKKNRKMFSKILSRFTYDSLRRSDVVMSPKENVSYVYWILNGTFRVKHENHVLYDMSRGERFGDVEIFSEEDHQNHKCKGLTTVSVASKTATILKLSRHDLNILGSDVLENMKRNTLEKAIWLKTQINKTSSSSKERRRKPFQTSDPFASSISSTIRETSKNLFTRDSSESSMGLICDASAHSVSFLKRLSERSAV